MNESVSLFGKKQALKKSSDLALSIEQRPGGWLIVETKTPQGETVRERVFYGEKKGKFSFSYKGTLYSGEIQKKSSSSSNAASAGGDHDLTAQFPGKVRKILVTDGAAVQLGDSLILVEAMKMEFSIKAPAEGCVKKILVKEGQELSPGDLFLEFEPK